VRKREAAMQTKIPGRAGLGTSVVIGRGGLVEGDAGA
jgi:hypothetical protein